MPAVSAKSRFLNKIQKKIARTLERSRYTRNTGNFSRNKIQKKIARPQLSGHRYDANCPGTKFKRK